jgi:tetratricopeptide (TPR) repeat protein
METGKAARAAEAFAAAAALGPLDADTTHDRALALLQSNDAAGAKRVLAAIPQQSRNDATEELAGEAEERLGDFRQAEEHFSQAAHLNRSEPNIYAWVVELLQHFSWQPAVKIAEYGIQRYPASTRLKAARGIAFYADNRYKEAADVFSALLAGDPANAMWASLLGRNCSLIADATLPACEKLQRFAEQHPRNAEAATYAATALLHQPADKRDNAKAQALLEQATSADPSLADTWYQLGVLNQEESHWQQSTAPLEKAIGLKPSLAEAHYRLARAYSHLGRRDDAAKEIALQQRYSKEQKDSVDTRLKEVTTFLTATP